MFNHHDPPIVVVIDDPFLPNIQFVLSDDHIEGGDTPSAVHNNTTVTDIFRQSSKVSGVAARSKECGYAHGDRQRRLFFDTVKVKLK